MHNKINSIIVSTFSLCALIGVTANSAQAQNAPIEINNPPININSDDFIEVSGSGFNYDFSYVFDQFVSIEGMIDGTLSSVDNDTIRVNNVMATLTSTGGTLGNRTFSFDTTLGGFHISGSFDENPGFVSLSGNLFDLAVIAEPIDNVCLQGAGFCLIGTFASSTFPGPQAQSYTLDSANFEISAKEVIPEPMTILGSLFVFGFGSFLKRQYSK
ncbi:MAG: PEP-CTERM sorting domain-containing protein [Gloeocapsa sp. DLM2.Bin57]|nr:MAG: PEP-CTERM sorting domain-containing protein [Gloeocapsa sp. DLM2.Bin57]